MKNQLEQLKQMTTIVADTGDIEAIKKFKPVDATTNPSLLLKASALPAYKSLLADAKLWAEKRGGGHAEILANMTLKFAVLIGVEILKIVPGRISTEVDARLSYDVDATLKSARQLIEMYNEAGIANDRILIKMASTWQGIKAAEQLEKEGINCNLTLLFGFGQAAACADAGVFLISPFVGRILDWYKANHTDKDFSGENDPGVKSVKEIYNFYKVNNYNTIVMGASFRNINEIQLLAGCDRLTIGPNLLEELSKVDAPLSQALSADTATSSKPVVSYDETLFKNDLEADKMATEKLTTGIEGFVADQIKLETLMSSI
ncbi:MAG: transaldolase [Alphaproteobacteria bacterium]|nr:transaldolase [Alphaproteobacteria bacterium]